MIVDKIELDEDEKYESDYDNENNKSIKMESKKKIQKVNIIII